jgi:hypothetical protein
MWKNMEIKEYISEYKYILLSVIIAAMILSIVLLKTRYPSYLEKIGKVKEVTFIDIIPGDCCTFPLTHVLYEDGDYIQYHDLWKNIEVGKTYRILYKEEMVPAVCDDPYYKGLPKSSLLNVIKEIEEIAP